MDCVVASTSNPPIPNGMKLSICAIDFAIRHPPDLDDPGVPDRYLTSIFRAAGFGVVGADAGWPVGLDCAGWV